jgi:hypothetical protein
MIDTNTIVWVNVLTSGKKLSEEDIKFVAHILNLKHDLTNAELHTLAEHLKCEPKDLIQGNSNISYVEPAMARLMEKHGVFLK